MAKSERCTPHQILRAIQAAHRLPDEHWAEWVPYFLQVCCGLTPFQALSRYGTLWREIVGFLGTERVTRTMGVTRPLVRKFLEQRRPGHPPSADEVATVVILMQEAIRRKVQ